MMMMMMMMMINCFYGLVDRRKAFNLIFSRDHCQIFSPSRISDTPRAGFESAQNLSLDFVELGCAVVITTKVNNNSLRMKSVLFNSYFFYKLRQFLGDILKEFWQTFSNEVSNNVTFLLWIPPRGFTIWAIF